MKDPLRSLLFSFSIVIASVVIGASIIRAAKIIGNSIKAKEADGSAKIISELVKTLKEKDLGWAREAAGIRRMPEAIGSKKVEGVTAGTNPIEGNAKAPVLMVEFSDFQCPFSKRFYQQTFPQIDKEYIATGKVKFVYRDFPLGFHPFANPAAVAVRCAGKQGKYWQMFDKLLLGNSLDKETLKKYALELGLNVKTYEECQDAPEIKGAVESDLRDAEKFGVQGTPTFFINGRVISGAYPFDVFKKIIEEELAKSVKTKVDK